MREIDEREAYIALNMMEKIGPVGVRSLVSALGSAQNIFNADRGALMRADGIGPEVADAILRQKNEIDWRGEMDRAAAMGAHIVSWLDEDYPKPLSEIHDPPLALYVKGGMEARDKHAIAIVGTRHPTHYGKEWAERLAFQIAKAGFTVVSGLAEGIDTAAHRGALKGKGRTLAVIGSGLDCLYPPSNAGLAELISEQGALITEFPLGRNPDKTTFPMRNRIVSGLSMGVLVVEAGLKSGALITAGQALEQGRSVFAVPGRIDSRASFGTHKLIKEGARLVAGVDDILAEYEFLMPSDLGRSRPDKAPKPNLSEDESRLLEILQQGERDVDTLIRSSGLKPGAVNSLLIGLEMKRMIRMLPGRIVEAR